MTEYILYKRDSHIERRGDNVCIRFYSDAQRFVVKYAVSEIVDGNFPHVGVTAREGIAMLFREHDENFDKHFSWKPVDVLAKDTEVSVNMSHIVQKGKKYEMIMFGPILSCLDQVLFMVENGTYFQLHNPDYKRRLLVIGGQETFGIGVTSTPMMFSNILRRNYCAQVDRISCCNKNFLNNVYEWVKELGQLSDYDVVICEIDELGQDANTVKEYLEALFHQISEAKRVIVWHALDETFWKRRQEIELLIKSISQEHSGFSYLNLDFLFEPKYVDRCTYSTNFINDAANILIYRALNKELEALQWNI